MLKGPSNTMQCFKRGDGGEVDENRQVEGKEKKTLQKQRDKT